MRTLIKGTLVGGILAYIWGAISWMGLSWHDQTFEGFKNESVVQAAIAKNIEESGVYLLPRQFDLVKDSEQKNQVFVFAAIQKDWGEKKSPLPFVFSFFNQVLIAFLLTLIAKNTHLHTYFGRVSLLMSIVIVGGIMVYFPLWTWWKFSPIFIGVNFVDLLATWILPVLFISLFTKKNQKQIVGLE